MRHSVSQTGAGRQAFEEWRVELLLHAAALPLPCCIKQPSEPVMY